MFSLFTQMTLVSHLQGWIRSMRSTDTAQQSGIANALMERSQARGLSSYQAEELRLAARAYLSVVR